VEFPRFSGHSFAFVGELIRTKVVSDAGSGIVYGYGAAKRLTSETTFGRTVGFDYDLAGNRTKVTWPDRCCANHLMIG
jgi:YD repeat-containing protein